MNKTNFYIMVFGISITVSFLGFLSYLAWQSKQYIQQPSYVSMGEGEPTRNIESAVVRTSEVRPKRPHIINHHLNDANVWYKIDVPRDIVTWQLKARGNHDLHYSYEPSHSTYSTLTSGTVLSEDTSPNMDIRAVYVMCGTAGVVAEMELWKDNHD